MKMQHNTPTKTQLKNILAFLLKQWSFLIHFAAIESLQLQNLDFQLSQGSQINFTAVRPVLRIELIKTKIINIFPQAICILPSFEDEIGLSPDDFIEMYIQHQKLSIKKVKEIMKKTGL